MMYDDPNTALFNKMTAEQEQYKAELLLKSPQEILNSAYEYALREDILFSMDTADLTNEQAEALLQTETPLNDIVQTIDNLETSYMDMVREGVEQRANEVLAAQRTALLKEKKDIPLYLHDVHSARENNEMELYRASFHANVACRDAIDTAIHEHYDGNRLGTAAVTQVVEQFGMDRVLHVLAATARYKEWDGRISSEHKEWAFHQPDPDPTEHCVSYVIHASHPGLVDLFMKQTREMVKEQQRPSVIEQLQSTKTAQTPKKSVSREPER
ncbi:MAG: DUF3849 domain-containing protein [Clostridia bacterium]|nr:DUF3849 domain-containing protein [Clostridia bacterium]